MTQKKNYMASLASHRKTAGGGSKKSTKTKKRPRVLTGIQPSGALHLGNYLATVRPMLAWQDKSELIIFIADLHAMTSTKNADELKKNIEDVVFDYLAFGFDPEKCLIFRQSDVYQVCLLSWILACVTPYGLLQRAHAFKDAMQNKSDINAGLFTYPVLMAADILMYKTDIVPVGQDQGQHVEISRELARNFNKTYGDLFPVPRAQIDKDARIIPGIDGRKMSKSYGNTIPLFADEKEIQRLVMQFLTDPARTKRDIAGNPDICPLFVLHKSLSTKEQEKINKDCRTAEIGCVEDKKIIFRHVMDVLAPIQDRRQKLVKNIGLAREVLHNGAKRASKIADQTLMEVKKMTGLDIG